MVFEPVVSSKGAIKNLENAISSAWRRRNKFLKITAATEEMGR
jgi:hypothetical protein